jgi:spore germination protein KB
MPKVRISGGLFACICAIYLSIAQFMFLPGPLSQAAGQEAWLAVVGAGVLGLLHGLFAAAVALRHPRLGPAQVARQGLGKWVGGGFGLVYAAYFTFILGLSLRDLLDFVQMLLLPGTPGMVIVVLFAATCLYGVWQGLEPLARVAFQTLITLVLLGLVMPLLVSREYGIKQIEPFLYRGLPGLVEATLKATSWFVESVAVMSLVPHLRQPRQAYRWLAIGMGTGVLWMAGLVAQTVLIFGSNLPERFVFPIYYMTQLISLARIVERIEIIMVIVWLAGMFIKASLYLYIAAETAGHVFGLKSHRWPAVGLTVVGVALSQIWVSVLDLIAWNSSWTGITILTTPAVGFPVLVLIASVLYKAAQGRRGAHA